MKRKPRARLDLIGAAGVYYVACELSRRGLIALPTVRNTAGIDLVVMAGDGSWSAALQVKTSFQRVGFWPLGTKEIPRRKNLFFIFLRAAPNKAFEAFVVPSERVASEARFDPKGKFPPSWYLPKVESDAAALKDNWESIGKTT